MSKTERAGLLSGGQSQQPYRRASVWNGVFIGLALALGVWGVEAVRLAQTPVPLQYSSLILGSCVLVGLAGFTGWLTGRWEKTGWALLAWLVTAVLASFLIAYQPTIGRTLTVWLADRRFWGLPVYPFSVDSLAAPLLAGFFVILVLSLLAVLQNYRLESVGREVNENGRLQIRAWLQLLLPLPVVVLAGIVTRDVVGDPSAQAVQAVHQAIQRTLAYDGDLFELGLREGLNYSALNAVRDQLSPGYTLAIGGLEPEASITYVVAHFDNGAWVNCRLISDYLSFCFDAAPPYTIGLASLITGEELPENCFGCLPQASEEWPAWLRSKGVNFSSPPQIRRLAQWGGYVLMRVEADGYALDCWFSGISPVRLSSCEGVEN